MRSPPNCVEVSRRALGRAAPDWLEMLEAINVRVGPGRILIPDLVVVTNPGLDLKVWDPADVAMIVEIVSPGSVAADRAIKPQLYATAASNTSCASSSGSRLPARWRTGCSAIVMSKSRHRRHGN